MALTGCYAFIKHIVTLLNILYLSCGLLLMFLALWMLIDPTFSISMAQDEASYYAGVYLILFIGALLVIVGFLGCAAAISESQCSLVLYFCLLLTVLVAQISAVIWIYANSDKLEKLVQYTVKKTVQSEYGLTEARTETFDAIQSGFKCCGASGPADWASSKYNNSQTENINLAISSPEQSYKIPASCCSSSDAKECSKAQTAVAFGPISKLIYLEGCTVKLVNSSREYMIIFLLILVTIATIEFFGLILALILCCAIRAVNTYKN
ncbi:Tetraspanin/Peripherin,Tetraspanin,Tetraspanin, EC2 domain [Cinara cedri]|uniref:Tetraspanin n=1 Tax=Cinara cedri TaxID=506608 RepID=A0A5E4MQG5_9HEMI|nr:Tetraspanin/Peripherin,Tetraspanin,Tetraspanin, EC2 domain [Cinara cedri]